ncbi:MAG: PAS domain S-box protein [Nitrospiraceae bacterium]
MSPTRRLQTAGAGEEPPVPSHASNEVGGKTPSHSGPLPIEASSVHRLLQAIDYGLEGLAIVDRSGRFTYTNASHASIYGYGIEELLGTPWQHLFDDVWVAEIEQFYFPILTAAGHWRGELTGRTKAGRDIAVELSMVLLKDSGDPNQWILWTCRDVSARRATERLVLARQESLAQAQALAHLGSWEWDLTNNTETWSDEQFRIFGYAPQAMMPSLDTFRDAIHPDDRARVVAAMDRAVAEQSEFNQECRIVRPDGGIRVIHCRGALVPGLDGHGGRMAGTVLDVTESKQFERQLDEAHQRLRLATESGGIGVWDLSIRDGRLVWDDRMLALYGYTRQTFPGTYQAWMGRLYPSDRAVIERSLATAIKQGSRFDAEFRVQRPDRTLRYIKAKGVVLPDPNGTPSRMIGVNYDITQRKEIQDAQSAQQHLLSAISEAQSQVLASLPANTVFECLLQNLLALTNSSYGIIGEICYEAGGTPEFRTYAVTDRVADLPESSESIRAAMGERPASVHPGPEALGIRAWCAQLLQTGEAEIVNDPAADTRLGHDEASGQAVESLVALPLKLGDRLVAMAVIVNRPGGYTPALVHYLQPYLQTCAAIHERIRAETVFQRSHALQQSMLNHAAYAVIAITTSGTVQHFNPAAERLLGYDAYEVVGHVSVTAFHDRQELVERAEALSHELGVPVAAGLDPLLIKAQRHLSNQLEWTYIKKDGTRVPVLLTVTALCDQNEQITGYMGMAMDLTAQKAAEAARLEQETRLRAIVDQAVDGIVTLDEDGVIESVNPAAERLFGYSGPEMVGRSMAQLMPDLGESPGAPGSGHSLRKTLSKMVGGGRELTGYRKDGRSVPVEVAISEMQLADQRRFTGLVRDITERKEADWKIKDAAHALECRNLELAHASDQALQATRAKSEFLASMSHEIRTPMNAIVGMAEMLHETGLSEAQREYVERLSRAANSLLDLINDILDVSKIEAGQLELERVAFDLPDLVDKTVEMLAVRAHAKSLELVVFVHPSVPTMVLGDPTRLRQVLVNLIGNAIKFTERGEVTLRVEPAADVPSGMGIRFAVADTGIGIPEDKIETIFERFTQVDSSTTRKYGGTGLGLSISKRLVELMGGTIRVESLLGLGTTFSVVIQPERVPDSGADALHAQAAALLRGKDILVVDGPENSRIVVRQYLKAYGCMVTDVDTVEEALRLLDPKEGRRVSYSAVVLDVSTDATGGVESVGSIRRLSAGSTVPILLETYEMNNSHEERWRALQVTTVLFKPLSQRRLIDALLLALAPKPTVLAAPSPTLAPSRKADAPPCLARRILVVEDLEDNRDVVRLFLKDTACTLDMAENGAVAVEKFKVGQYDLVLMDMQMPVMDGYEAVETIRRFELEEHRVPTPVLALTANAIREEIERSLMAGCDAHLTKPIKKNTLLEAIRQYTPERGTEEAA